MKIIYNKFIPFKGFKAINLFGILFVRGTISDINLKLLNHEKIHTAQMKELGYILFYIIYILEWLYRLMCKGNAYRNISFEKEAYNNENNLNYLNTRKKYNMWRKSKCKYYRGNNFFEWLANDLPYCYCLNKEDTICNFPKDVTKCQYYQLKK